MVSRWSKHLEAGEGAGNYLEEHNAASDSQAFKGRPGRDKRDVLGHIQRHARLSWVHVLRVGLVKEHLGLDHQVFLAKRLRVWVDASQLCQRRERLFLLVSHEEEPRRLREEDHADAQDQGGRNLQREGYPP